jgi:peptidylamidoglycolate lyase
LSSFEVQHGWPQLPSGEVLGFVSGADVDSHGHVFTAHTYRPWAEPFSTDPVPEAVVQMWDGESGALLTSWGSNTFRLPHGLSVDQADNVWVTDVGASQVFKFTHDGLMALVLGEMGVEGADGHHFGRPTDIAFGTDGRVYISDGYANSRVVVFSPNGEYLSEWGSRGNGRGQFNLPHGLAVDMQGRVYVADRENDRIQVFEPDGTFLHMWESHGMWRPYGIAISPRHGIFVVDGGEQATRPPHRSGVVRLDESGHVAERFGRYGNQDGQFLMGHDLTVDSRGNVHVADVMGQRLQRFSRTTDSTSGFKDAAVPTAVNSSSNSEATTIDR